MGKKVLLIVSCIELILSLYYTFSGCRDGLTELFLVFDIFLWTVSLALVVSFVLMWFPSKTGWRTSVFLHCLTCPCIFLFTCMAVPDFEKNAFESYNIQIDDESTYLVIINTYNH